MRLKREMNATSSQDQFAKWAKLRRQHDKALAQCDEKSMAPGPFSHFALFEKRRANACGPTANSFKSFKSTFDRTVTVLRWGGTNGLRFFLQFWYAKKPLFWIPKGWVPSYVEWLLAFPRAPTGSVSIQMWGIACATVVQLVSAAVVAGIVLVREQQQGRQKVKIGASDGGGKKEDQREL